MSHVKSWSMLAVIAAAVSSLMFLGDAVHPQSIASAQPQVPVVMQVPTSVEVITNIGDGFAENVVQLPDGSLAVSGGDGLRRIPLDGTEGSMLFDAQSLGGVIVYGNKLLVAVGNDPIASVTNQLKGSIRSIDLATYTLDEQPFAAGISAPNGLAALDDGTVLYTTNSGDYQGVHRVGDDPRQVLVRVPSANGLSVGTDGTLYVGSTLGMGFVKVDLVTGQITDFGFTLFCDDLAATSEGIYRATVVGLWTPGAAVPFWSPELTGLTSIKFGLDGRTLFGTTMLGNVLRVTFF